MYPKFSTLIITKPEDFKRLSMHYPRLLANLPSEQLIFISSDPILEYLRENHLESQTGYLNESDILPFCEVHSYLSEHMREILGNDELPRGATGWYYQQFLKMQYAYHCPDEYYMVWDGDTIPCAPFSMFQEGTNVPYLDMKSEYHEEYFITLEKLLPGMKKCVKKSFISEHMLFSTELMKKLIETIEGNDRLPGKTFWQKIISAIPPLKIVNSAFSEFETYGTFVAFTRPDLYRLREWHSFRLAGEFFDPATICERDFRWLSHDFQAISFEKGHSVRPDNRNLFDNPRYQEKLSARQMLEIAQEEFHGGYLEVWGDSDAFLFSDPLAVEKDTSTQITMSESEFYEHLGDSLLYTNTNQAYLCYENAAFLSSDESQQQKLREKMQTLQSSGSVNVQKTAICIVSYNNKETMQRCIWSIREHCAPDAYSLVITDNASTDGVAAWLESVSDDMTVILNEENAGFSGGCNLCLQYAAPDQDIFLLNNDTQMTHNALFWLRMGLYSDDMVGAAGCMANYAGNEQMITLMDNSPAAGTRIGRKQNIPLRQPYREMSRLCGFAMLIRRSLMDEIGGLDPAFSPGYYEDDDLSLQIRMRGYRMLVCHNSFIYHEGRKSFKKHPDLDALLERNHNYIMNKWKFDCITAPYISLPELQFMEKIQSENRRHFRLLEIGCGTGNFLSLLQYHFPQAQLFGIDADVHAIRFGVTNLPLLAMDWMTQRLPFPMHSFDYILLRYWDEDIPDEALITSALSDYLHPDGSVIHCHAMHEND